jgi:hypothetical protein
MERKIHLRLKGENMFAIRFDLLKKAIEDKETSEKLKNANSWLDIMDILEDFAKKEGFKVKKVKA